MGVDAGPGAKVKVGDGGATAGEVGTATWASTGGGGVT